MWNILWSADILDVFGYIRSHSRWKVPERMKWSENSQDAKELWEDTEEKKWRGKMIAISQTPQWCCCRMD